MKNFGMTIVVLLVLLGTVYFVFTVPPEERVTWSADEMVRLEYVAESGTYLKVDPADGGVSPQIYTVEPNNYIFAAPADLIFYFTADQGPVDQLFIGELNSETSEWEILPTEYNRERGELSTQVDQVAQWALIQYNGADQE